MRGPKPYDEGEPSAAAAPVGAPPHCIETRRALLPGKRNRLGCHETIFTKETKGYLCNDFEDDYVKKTPIFGRAGVIK